jgi:hypothetical protein
MIIMTRLHGSRRFRFDTEPVIQHAWQYSVQDFDGQKLRLVAWGRTISPKASVVYYAFDW